MEAALRTAADLLTGESRRFHRGRNSRYRKGLKRPFTAGWHMETKVAVVSGLSNADALLKKVRSGEADYQFIEVMCCPGGCVNGGGQPIQSSNNHSFYDIKRAPRPGPVQSGGRRPRCKGILEPRAAEMLRGVPGRARKPQGPRDPPHLLRQARLLMKY